jgi:pilus assembly protein FimV
VLGPVWAAGLAGGSAAVMGQTLDFPVQVRLEPDEALSPECLSAEVRLGDRRLPAGMVRTALEITGPSSARVRVLTTQAVDEPVVGVLLNANCGTVRVSRRFVVLADPPLQAAAPTAAAVFTPAFAATPAVAPEAVAAESAAGVAPAVTAAAAEAPAVARTAAPAPASADRQTAARPAAARCA